MTTTTIRYHKRPKNNYQIVVTLPSAKDPNGYEVKTYRVKGVVALREKLDRLKKIFLPS